MKKSILTRLIGGTVLLVVTIALLALCFFAGLRLDRTIAEDSNLLAEIQRNVQTASLHAALLLSADSVDIARRHASLAREASTQILLLVAARPSTVQGAWIYPLAARESLAATLSTLTSGWQDSLQQLMDDAPGAFQSVEARARFRVRDEAFIADSEQAASVLSTALVDVFETRRSVARSALALFALVVGIGTISALAYSLWSLFVLRRDVRTLLVLGRRISAGDLANLPQIRRADEIGEVAAQLQRLGSLQTLAASLRTSAERLDSEHRKVMELGARALAVVKGLARAVEEAARGFTGVVQSVKSVEATAATGQEAAGQGSAAVESSLEKITQGMEAAHALEERTARVEEAVSVIGDVADQTELLSLNAAIEAARAGEMGRGFSVVAQQVRKLADRSARSASEITDLVQSILDGVRRIGGDAREALESERQLRRVLQNVTAAISALTELAHAAAEGAERAEGSLGTMQGAAAEAARRVDELIASGRALHVIMEGVNRSLQQFAEDTREAEHGPKELSAGEMPAGDVPTWEAPGRQSHASDLGGRVLPAEEPMKLARSVSALPLSLGITPVDPEEGELLELEPALDDAVPVEPLVEEVVGAEPPAAMPVPVEPVPADATAGPAPVTAAGAASGPAESHAGGPAAVEEIEELEAADD
jgi:methyl-accepting chemotaxis protein